MQPDVEQQLRSQAKSLRALARDLVGDRDADDLVQDTALQVLRSPPSRPGPLAGWFATVLRHLAFRHRRAARRRAVHEAQLPVPGEVAPAEAGLEQQEMLARVTAAVLALPQPYRGVVLLRYFEDLSPKEIAGRVEAPVATVKSRLQRGLVMLRERLDEENEGKGEWRALLAGAFGLGKGAAVAAGVVLMGTGVKLALGGAAAAVALATWFMIQPAPPAAPTQHVAQQQAPSPVVADSGTSAATAQPPIADRREVPTPPPTTTPLATIRGRCVDADGNPVAGIRIALTGKPWPGENPAENPDVLWQDLPRISTPTDGCFEFRFAPPRTYSFELGVGDADHVGGYCRWQTLAADQVVEIGDVPILQPLPWQLHLHVVDTDDKPVAQEHVYLEWTAPPWFHSALEIACGGGELTDDEGSCRWQHLLPGSYKVSVEGRDVVRGARLELTRVSGDRVHQVVASAVADDDVLRGIVVDENGAPVPRVSVTGMAGPANAVGARTDEDGRFQILRKPSYGAEPVQLWVYADGFEVQMPSERFAWGRTDVRMVLRHDSALEVLAFDDRGTPLESYRAWVVPDQSANFHGNNDPYSVRANGRHPDGIAAIAGLHRGPYFVIVQAEDPTFAISRPVSITVGDPPARVLVHLQRAAHRLLRVQRPDGTPVVGSTVQLLDPVGNVACLPNRVVSLQCWVSCTGNGTAARLAGDSVLMQETATAARGQAELRGVAGKLLTVVVRGPSHCPTQFDGVRLDVAEPLVMTVVEGARLTGRAQPEVIHALRELAGLPATGPVLGQNRTRLPGLVLSRGNSPNNPETYPTDNSLVDFADDGCFAVDHVPEGAWRVVLRTERNMQSCWEDVAAVELRDGLATDIQLDLSAATPCELSGRVFMNDKPLDSASLPMFRKLQLLVAGPDLAGKNTGFGGNLLTNADGHFVWRGRAGTATLRKSTYVVAPESVVLTPGGHATQDFHFSSGLARLHLIDADGKPVPQSLIELFDAASARLPMWTDDTGVCESELPPGSFRAQAQCMRDGKLGPTLGLDNVTITAGKTTELTLRLPRE